MVNSLPCTGGARRRGRRSAGRPGRAAQALAAILVAALTAVPQRIPAQTVSEYEVKAAFLYNFAKFVEWPAAAVSGDSMFVCVLDNPSFAGVLQSAVVDKTVQQHRLAVRVVSHADDARRCHVLFLGDPQPQAWEILAALEGAPVLIVGDTEDIALHGGMIAFRMEGNKVRFVINAAAAGRAGLSISSQLLKLAARVIDESDRR